MCDPPTRKESYFGGKSRVAPEVWRRIGDVPNMVDPFLGSNAFLLARPHWDWARGGWRDDMTRLETVNDLDGMVSNLWRAIAADPEEVARHADWPTNENDLHARHIWLVQRKDSLQVRLEGDPDFYDAKIAGWWLHGICCWIGGGWCSGEGPWTSVDGKLVKMDGGAGEGVERRRVHLGNAGQGVNRRLPHLGNAGMGVNRKRPLITDDGVGVTRNSGGIQEWMRALASRLRRVRVCCGDWSRVCGPTPTVKQGLTGVILDPPYAADRDNGIYATDSFTVAEDVRRWAIEHGEDPRMRIALCSYSNTMMPENWEVVRWRAHGGYGTQGAGRGRENATRETIWFSPHCLKPDDGPAQMELEL